MVLVVKLIQCFWKCFYWSICWRAVVSNPHWEGRGAALLWRCKEVLWVEGTRGCPLHNFNATQQSHFIIRVKFTRRVLASCIVNLKFKLKDESTHNGPFQSPHTRASYSVCVNLCTAKKQLYKTCSRETWGHCYQAAFWEYISLFWAFE